MHAFRMSTLLVPLDTSDISGKVLAQAEKLGRQLGAGIALFHVVEPIATYVPVGTSMDAISTSPPLIDIEEQTGLAKSRLEKLAEPLRASGLEVTCEAVLGIAVEEIVEQAGLLAADYIVVGSHGHGALYHMFSGSVVTGVLKHSPCPVVVVPVRS